MRTDVKLGIVTSMVVVLAAGGYFLIRSDSQAPIPIADKASPTAPKTAAKPPAGKQPVTNPSRQVTTSKDAAGRTNLPVNRDPKVATKPADRPPVATPKEIPVYRAPVVEAKSDPPTTPPITVPSPAERTPLAERTSLAERSPDSTPTTPVTSPAGAIPSSVPGAVTAREPYAGHTSRTLMAGNEPAKSAPTTPADSAALPSPAPVTPIAATKPQPSGAPSEIKLEPGKAAVDTHRVQPGDSLASLAQTYYGNAKYAKFLAESNPGISDPAKLSLGATIKIPPLPQDVDTRMANAAPAKVPAAAATGKKTYKVKTGDSFYKIAKEQLGNAERWKELLDLNKTIVHGDPTQLQPGQTLVLPD
jgi:nucleoid-associated protein YgaU